MKVFIHVALLMFFALSIQAQQKETSAQNNEKVITLSGIVYDITGAVVGNTNVSAKNSENKIFQTKTNDDGVFNLKLIPANYEIEFEAVGFKKVKLSKFRVVNSTYGKISQDIVLEVRDCNDCEWVVGEPIKENKKPK